MRIIKKILRILGIFFLICMTVSGIFMIYLILQSSGNRQISSANFNATSISYAFTYFITDLNRENLLPKEQPEIISGDFSHQPEENTPEYYISSYCNNLKGYYVIVLKKNWTVDYILWSRCEITSDEIHPWTLEEQNALLKNLWIHNGELIGCYQNIDEE